MFWITQESGRQKVLLYLLLVCVYLCCCEDASSGFMFWFCVCCRVSSIRTTSVSSVGTSWSLGPVNMCALFSSVPVSPWWVTQDLWKKITLSSYFEPRKPLCVCMCCHICARQVEEVMLMLKQAFSTAAALQSNKTEIQLCEACPIHDLHKLCERIEGDSNPLDLSLALFMNIMILGVLQRDR